MSIQTEAINTIDLCREYDSPRSFLSRKSREKVVAINKINLAVRSGEIFGLLGPNGAGKTTTIKVLSTLLSPTSGSASVLGYDLKRDQKQIRKRINFVLGGDRGLYMRLSAIENLQYFADLYMLDTTIANKRIGELLAFSGLEKRAKDRLETYSKGMLQKVLICRGLINDPDILFLDEPTVGLDPESARQLRIMISYMSDKGKTILLTTHYMHEAEDLCSNIAIINKGEVVEFGSPASLKKRYSPFPILEVQAYSVNPETIKNLKVADGVSGLSIRTFEDKQNISIITECPEVTELEVSRAIPAENILKISVRPANLEDSYLRIVGQY